MIFVSWLVIGAEASVYPDCNSSTCTSHPAQVTPWVDGRHIRVGEAANPGPTILLDDPEELDGVSRQEVKLGSSNPSGLRRKEALAIEQGPGIWAFSETQLSAQTQQTSTSLLKHLASQQSRRIKVHHGAPAPLRHNSTWAGSWTGVAILSDASAVQVKVPMPQQHWNSGRLLTTRHYVGRTSVTCTTVYGYPKGPTFPRAHELTDQLLEPITQEVVYGMAGPRVILGDFNASDQAEELRAYGMWRRLGWRSAQEFGHLAFDWDLQPTCKASTAPDQIWLSPEILSMVSGLENREIYSEHTSLVVCLAIPEETMQLWAWPKPAPIPWNVVDETLSIAAPIRVEGETSTQTYANLWHSLEHGLQNKLDRPECPSLQRHEQGRGQRTRPQRVHEVPPLAKPSRQGEVCLQSDLTGGEVKRWFKQLRRLQSLCHALRAGKHTAGAQQYRAELWGAIRRSPGFHGGWEHWWNHVRPLGWDIACFAWPAPIPTLDVLDSAFAAFQLNFTSFESWHIRQRARSLKEKYDRNMQALFHELRDQPPEHPQHFVEHSKHEIKREGSCLTLDPPAPREGALHWTSSQGPVTLQWVDGRLPADSNQHLETTDSLCCTCTKTAPNVLQADLVKHWHEHWNNRKQPTEEEWMRITGFFHHYMPQIGFTVPLLDQSSWNKALRKYKPRAARGADGVSHVDLQRLPDELTSSLLTLLQNVEQGTQEWPRQLKTGLCIALAKKQGADTPASHRPICIFSIVYRTWGALRARQLLRQLASRLPADQYGFVPHIETAQYWLNLQSVLELTQQSHGTLSGITTDLRKAFNTISRSLTWNLAEHLQVPAEVLGPWRSFLEGCQRRFVIGTHVSEPITSCSGFPEGDSMSVYCMVQLDMAFHCYMAAFAPRCRTLSYVDNLGITAPFVPELVQGFACLEEFFSLWTMSTDPQKTVAWSTQSEERKVLRLLDFQIQYSASELGGALHFSRCHSLGHFRERQARLDSKWQRLQKSQAPFWQRARALYQVFWPSGLHGMEACHLAEIHLSQLRTKAIKHLAVGKAGQNAMLRLTLSASPLCDPGFFLLVRTVHTMRRLFRKDLSLLSSWASFMLAYRGELLDGPYSVLMSRLHEIGWAVQPPHVVDHDGLTHHFIELDERAMDRLLWEGWLQHVSRTAARRPSMVDGEGLDPDLVTAGHSSLTALELAHVAALQSGAFMSTAYHSKYDRSKSGTCGHCGQLDTHQHWLECPGYAAHRPLAGWPRDFASWPLSLRAHLHPSRNPYSLPLKRYLHSLPDLTSDFFDEPVPGTNHVFTDGAYQHHLNAWMARSAWAAVNASSGKPVAAGTVPGLQQGSDVAEIYAVIAALNWTSQFGAKLHLWCDNKAIVGCVEYLLKGGGVNDGWGNLSLWHQVAELLGTLEHQPAVNWIPSHWDPCPTECPYEDWHTHWNGRADQLAGLTNDQRDGRYFDLVATADRWHQQVRSQLQQLQRFYSSVAKGNHVHVSLLREPEPDPSQNSDDGRICLDKLSDVTPILWQPILEASTAFEPVLIRFASQVLAWWVDVEDPQTCCYQVSHLELLFMLLLNRRFMIPVGVGTGQASLVSLSDALVLPTVSELLAYLRKALNCIFGAFEAHHVRIFELDRSAFHVFTPQDGVRFAAPVHLLTQAQSWLLEFTRTRPVRGAASLARPPPVGMRGLS